MNGLQTKIPISQRAKLDAFFNGQFDKIKSQLEETLECPIGVTTVTTAYVSFYTPNRLMFALVREGDSLIFKMANFVKFPIDIESDGSISRHSLERIKSSYNQAIQDTRKAIGAFDVGSIFPYTLSVYTPKSPFKIHTLSTKATFLFIPYETIEEYVYGLVNSDDQVSYYIENIYPKLKIFERYIHKMAWLISNQARRFIHPDNVILYPQMSYKKEIYRFLGQIRANNFTLDESEPMNTITFLTKVITFQIVSLTRHAMFMLLKDKAKIYFVNEAKSSFDLVGYPLIKRSNSPFDRSRVLQLNKTTLSGKPLVKVIDSNTATTLSLLAFFNPEIHDYIKGKLDIGHNPYDEFTTYDFTKENLRSVSLPADVRSVLRKSTLESNNLVPMKQDVPS